MEILHSTEFDERFYKELPHLTNYPQMLPFIGCNWKNSKHKILFLGESHYIPGKDLSDMYPEETHVMDWYNNNSRNFDKWLSDYINTRNVINIAEKKNDFGHKKPLAIFYNMKAAIKSGITQLNEEKFTFTFFSFYNYFQRPAFVETQTIVNNPDDDKIAYQTLKKVADIIKPEKIIFVSDKAIKSFNRQKLTDSQPSIFQKIKVGGVPHPACRWWNMKSVPHGGKTGREKFMTLIS